MSALPISASNSRYASRIGTTIAGRYEITGLVGTGGMGAVFRARQAALRREIALKIIGNHLSDHEQALDRFRREAEIVASLSHPNIVTVHDFGETDEGELFLAMELLEGETLSQMIRRTGAMAWADTLPLIRGAAAALACAHENGIVHRDLKPDNIMIAGTGTGRVVKVLDFGVARFTLAPNVDEHGRPLTGAGMIVGSPGYLAPEALLDSANIDGRADLYGLGLTWLELLRGRPVFDAPSAGAILLQNARAAGTPLETLAVEVALPGALHHLLSTLLQPHPQQRPADGRAFLVLLDQAMSVLQGTPLPGPAVSGTLVFGSMAGAPSGAPVHHSQAPTSSNTLLYGSTSGSGAPLPLAHPQLPPTAAKPQRWGMLAVALVLAGASAAAGAALAIRSAGTASIDTAAVALEPASKPEPLPPKVVIIRQVEEPAASERDVTVTSAATSLRSRLSAKRAPAKRRGVRSRSAKPAVAKAEPATTSKKSPDASAVKAIKVAAAQIAPLSSSKIRSAFLRNQGTAAQCTNTNLVAKGSGLLVDHCPSYPTLSGTHRMEVDILPDGSVASATFLSQAATVAKIGGCIVDSVRDWRFPVSTEGAKRVRIPVDFQKCVPINGKCVFEGDG